MQFLYYWSHQNLVHELVLKIAKEQSDYLPSLSIPGLSEKETISTTRMGSVRWFRDNLKAYQDIR
ncbi:MAG: hypothetical protein JSV42_17525 [Chloroflexota bacterium]|nr:MAG: hypothetical protein JSV42_17525 [Chloroflexota bacterium]